MLLALTRPVSPSITDCALSYIERMCIDVERAQRQHDEYEACLAAMGARVVHLPAEPNLPDAVFVEDTAVVVDEVAVVTRPRLPSRQPEVASTEETLSTYRPIRRIEAPGTLEGGDVVCVGKTLYAGISKRTNEEGVVQLRAALVPYGYEVRPVPVGGCLHLKTACTYIGRNTLLANTEWVDTSQFTGMTVVAAQEDEAEAGNAVAIGNALLVSSAFPRTTALLEHAGFDVRTVDISELQKAEAGLTCCSVIFGTAG